MFNPSTCFTCMKSSGCLVFVLCCFTYIVCWLFLRLLFWGHLQLVDISKKCQKIFYLTFSVTIIKIFFLILLILRKITCDFHNTQERPGGVMVSLLASNAEGRGFAPWSSQTKDIQIGCFSAMHTAFRSKSKDWLAHSPSWIMFLVKVACLSCGLLLLWVRLKSGLACRSNTKKDYLLITH